MKQNMSGLNFILKITMCHILIVVFVKYKFYILKRKLLWFSLGVAVLSKAATALSNFEKYRIASHFDGAC